MIISEKIFQKKLNFILTIVKSNDIISLAENETAKLNKRVCWNRQTGTFEGRVSRDVWVQVPLLAPKGDFLNLPYMWTDG